MNKKTNYITMVFCTLIILLSGCKSEANKNSSSIQDTVVIVKSNIVLSDSITEEMPIIDTAEVIQQSKLDNYIPVVFETWVIPEGTKNYEMISLIGYDKEYGLSLEDVISLYGNFHSEDSIKKWWDECK